MFAFTLPPTFSSKARRAHSRPDSSIAVFIPEIVRPNGAVLESVSGQVPMFATIYRSVFTRLLAALIVVLVVSPYSEPFATMNGTDFGGSGAVDLGGSSKTKTPTQDALPTPPSVVIGSDHSLIDVRSIVQPVARDFRPGQRTILRL
mgnify:CR=1 FL=1